MNKIKRLIPILGIILAGIFVLPPAATNAATPPRPAVTEYASMTFKATCSTVALIRSKHVSVVKKTQYRKGPFAGLVIFFARANDGYTFKSTGTAFVSVHKHVSPCT